jgi:ubiquinone/menaquinone biosynthesis C-methylase UbiE
VELANNKELYTTVAFKEWAYRTNLISDEQFLIETYLDRDRKTLEAGTAGGRIAIGLQKMGFRSVHGYDYVPEFIAQAKQQDQSRSIHFEVQDATGLDYADASFEQILYLMQMISSIDTATGRTQALKEAYRILVPGGVALLSFLCFETRMQSPFYSLFINYLKQLRRLSGSQRPLQELPWLKHGEKMNFSALLDRAPYTYWYRLAEVEQQVRAAGFQIVGLGTGHQVAQEKLYASLEAFGTEPIDGMIYFVCTK